MRAIVLLAVWLGVAATAAVLVAIVRRASVRVGVVDRPNERSSHHLPTPRGGGLGMIPTIGLALYAAHATWPGLFLQPWPTIAVAAAVVALVSAIDDVRPLPAAGRLLVHLGVSVWTATTIGVATQEGLGTEAVIVANVIAVVWIAGLINAYNFMDGIDGIAGLQALVAGLGWVVIGTLMTQPTAALVGASVAAASLGFLAHNWPPARIFMGDVGSAFLGFLFAVVPLVTGRDQPWAYVVGILVVWPFVFDSLYTLIRRAWNGENVLQPHRSHLYQRLVRAGLGHAPVALGYGLLALVGAAVAAGVAMMGVTALPALALIPVCAMALDRIVRLAESRRRSA